jgi:hypothetical protein
VPYIDLRPDGPPPDVDQIGNGLKQVKGKAKRYQQRKKVLEYKKNSGTEQRKEYAENRA